MSAAWPTGDPARRRFHGWAILGVAFVLLGLAYTVWYSYSVFFVALLADLGWSRATTAAAVMLLMVVHGLSGPLVGALAGRLGVRVTFLLGSGVLAGALLACSQVREPWQLYLAFGVLGGLGVAMIGLVPNVTLLQRWFSRRLGLALGIGLSGIGVGFGLYIPAVQVLISTVGWRLAFVVMAAVALAVVVPLTLWLVRERPADVGQEVDGGSLAADGRPSDEARLVDRQWAARAWTLGAALRTPRFWLAVLSAGGSNVTPQIGFIHGPAILVDAGYDAMSAALVIGASGFVIIGGTVLWGSLSDRWGREVAYSLGLTCQAVSMLLLAVASGLVSPALAVALAVFFGLGYGVITPLVAAVAADMFRGPRFGAIYGVFILSSATVGGVTAWLAGAVFDLVQSYLPVIAGAIVVDALAIAAMWLAAPRRVRLAPGRVRRALAEAGGGEGVPTTSP